MTTRECILQIVNKLFIYTDSQSWDKLTQEVFDESVHLDMSSMGAAPMDTTPADICKMWEEGFQGLDAVNHLSGNYLVSLMDDEHAEVFAYATATHYKSSATKGQTREYVGTYQFKLRKIGSQWRIYYFLYNLKYATGNLNLE